MKRVVKRRWGKVLCVAAVAAALCLAVYLWRVAAYQRQVKGLAVNGVDLSLVADGTYMGSCDVGFIEAQVRVVVADGTITEIQLLKHKNGRGAPAERIPGDIIAQQRTDVDAVSGATNSSKVIEKAVENALQP